jgi:hypothetical protein
MTMQFVLAALLAVLAAGPSLAASGMEGQEPKGLVLETIGAPPAQPQSRLNVSVRVSKGQYQVGDKIFFYVNSNKDFFLWMFLLDDRTGQARVIIPGPLQKGNKYDGNRPFQVPTGSADLIAAAPGQYKVVIVASDKWLENMDLKNFAAQEGYYTTTNANVDVLLKGLVLSGNEGAPAKEGKKQIVVARFNVEVAGNPQTAQPPQPVFLGGGAAPDTPANSVVFVSQNSQVYNVGDRVSITYGANAPGFVQLFLQYPDGRSEFLTKQQVDGKTNYTINATAVPPGGPQTLMAVFNPSEQYTFAPERVQSFIEWVFQTRQEKKGLIIDPQQSVNNPQERAVYNVSRFYIR